ncbi:MAG: HmuY family protein [Rhodothermales bacterium]
MRTRILPSLFVATALLLSGCDIDPADESIPTVVETATEVPADPFIGFDPVTQRPMGADVTTYYSLRENRIVPLEEANTTAWDIALKGTVIMTNGGVSGPGQGGAQLLSAAFSEVVEAPESGYKTDAPDGFATVGLDGNDDATWYSYNPADNVVLPTPGRVLVIRCADGTFAKMRVLNYYKGSPELPTQDDPARYYSFEFVHQPDGSRRFE